MRPPSSREFLEQAKLRTCRRKYQVAEPRVGRRKFLGAALALGASAAVRGLAASATDAVAPPPPESGLSHEGLLKGYPGFQPRRPMTLPHPEIFGFLSREQLAQNYQAYRRDFQRLVVADRVLAAMPRDAAHENDYGLMRRQQVQAGNSVL